MRPRRCPRPESPREALAHFPGRLSRRIVGRTKNVDVGKRLSRLLSALLVIYSIAGIVLSSVVGSVIRLIADPAYWRAGEVVPIIVMSLYWGALIYIFQTGLLFAKHTRPLLVVSLFSNVSVLAFNIVLVPRFDVYGAALSYLLTNIAATTATYWFAQRACKIKYEFDALYKITPSFIFAVILVIGVDRMTVGFSNCAAKIAVIAGMLVVIQRIDGFRPGDLRVEVMRLFRKSGM